MNADNVILMNLRHRMPDRLRQRGTAIVEFALVFPFLLVLTLCVIDMSRAFWVKNVATQATREGARTAVVHTMSDTALVRARVEEVLNSAHVTMTTCTLEDLGDKQYRVTVGCNFNWLYPGLFNWLGSSFTSPVTLTAVTVMRKEG